MHRSKSRSGTRALNLPTNSSSRTHSNPPSTVPSWNTRTKRTPTISHTWAGTSDTCQSSGHGTHLEDHLGAERRPPQWDGAQPGEQAHQRAVVPHVERKTMRKRRCRERVRELREERACTRRSGENK